MAMTHWYLVFKHDHISTKKSDLVQIRRDFRKLNREEDFESGRITMSSIFCNSLSRSLSEAFSVSSCFNQSV